MLIRTPDYYQDFHCLAGACPHSCCTQWEVVIDEDTAVRYRSVPGPLGEKLRQALQTDADGDLCFPLNGGRCPFLDEENLCEIHRQLGESATSITCQEHPRFTEDFGPFREISLAASCPAANALLLGSEAPLKFSDTYTQEPEEPGDPWLEYLLPLRDRCLEILADRTRPLAHRLQQLLLLAQRAQDALDEETPEEILPLLPIQDPLPPLPTNAPSLSPAALELLTGLEILEPDWPVVLQKAAQAADATVSEPLLERIAVYFAFRYLLKSINDGDFLSRAQLVVYAVLLVRRLACVCGLSEALRRLSCELEHSEENLEAVLDAFRWQENVSIHAFLQTLQH